MKQKSIKIYVHVYPCINPKRKIASVNYEILVWQYFWPSLVPTLVSFILFRMWWDTDFCQWFFYVTRLVCTIPVKHTL